MVTNAKARLLFLFFAPCRISKEKNHSSLKASSLKSSNSEEAQGLPDREQQELPFPTDECGEISIFSRPALIIVVVYSHGRRSGI